jgi:hypothetical protein
MILLSQQDPNATGIEMVVTESMKYHSFFFKDAALSYKHTTILKNDIIALATPYLCFRSIETTNFQRCKP